MRRPILSFYKLLLLTAKQRQVSKGFTLLELLISLIISSLVVSGLLYVVVDLAKMDQREAVLDQVQSDIGRAMTYITEDLQEAVYVYPDPARIATELGDDPRFPDGAGTVPVLAFWRVDPIEEGLPTCDVANSNYNECQVLSIRQAGYTLVVYAQKENNNNTNWPGQSRLIRYELSQYSDLSTLTERAGYRDPTSSTDDLATFEVWEPDGTPAGFSAVLVDFVAAPDEEFDRTPLSDTGGACRDYGLDADSNPLYTVVPSNATTTVNSSFFACVRNPDAGADTTDRVNQDIYVFLRGDVAGASNALGSFSTASSLPILETQVLVKGIIDKDI